ncbi:MAG: ribonuclease R [Bdellovibrionota bacterium]
MKRPKGEKRRIRTERPERTQRSERVDRPEKKKSKLSPTSSSTRSPVISRQWLAEQLREQAKEARRRQELGSKGSGRPKPRLANYRDFDFDSPETEEDSVDNAAEVSRRRTRSRTSKQEQNLVIVHGEVQKNSRGFAFLLRKPQDLFIPAHMASPLLTGDVVKAWVDARTKEVSRVEITKRTIKSFIGTYDSGLGRRVVTLSDRTMREDVLIRERPSVPGLRDGHKVLVEITKYEPELEGKIVRSFGPELAPRFDTLAVVVKSQWPQEFSQEVQEEAERLSREIQEEAAQNKYRGRKDLRHKPFVTIDGKDARDFDDAVLVEKTPSGYVLYVAIADVAEFVRPRTKLDQEAYNRATSVYFPEWVVPMLPEALSNGACSLRPNEEKLTLTCEMHYDFRGKKRSAKVYESVIRSSRRCIYEDVDREAKGGDAFWRDPYELYQLIKHSRNKRGALDLDLPEAKIVLDENSDTIDIRKQERLDAHRLIEEFMIAANESVTEIMEREGWPFIYRVHEPPESGPLERFERFALALGLKPKLGGGSDPRLFSRFIESQKTNPMAQTLYYLMLRSLKQARYDPVNLKHFGLASQAYTHFTSPIRRYPDLIVHRILKRYCQRQQFEDEAFRELEDYLVEACEHCSKQERKSSDLERSVIKVKKARFMAKHMGEEFEARITNVNENGVYIELENWFVEGLVPIAELGGDYFEFIEERLMLKGKRTGKKYRIGDSLRASVLRTDLDNGFVDFTLAENLADAAV